MRDFLDLFQMIAECERKSRSASASFQKGAQMPVFPDEIDLYNFFERFDSHAIGKYHDFYAKYVAGRDLLAVFNIVDYLKERPNFVNITYWLGEHRYYAIRFKKRGVFLVSEKKIQRIENKEKVYSMIDVLIYGALLASMVLLAVSLGFNWEHCSKDLQIICVVLLLLGMVLLSLKLSLLC